MSRPALIPFNHPLCFPNSLERHSVNGNGVGVSKRANTCLVDPKTVYDKIVFMYEHQRIIDLLNEYCYILDSTSVDDAVFETWASLFTDDGEATYPFGTHKGREGLAQWAKTAETRFLRMQHLQSNFSVTFESDNIAHARSSCICTHGSHETDLSQRFTVGGYYYLTFRRVPTDDGDEWKISRLILDTNWESGQSFGLFDKREGRH
ncbi:hypothetical protein HIM_01200 [Hirsutella minnesotensis 3608]|nr:hypothetical protein HIM_01200 [Hirsutella minnesotensis 3608]